MKLFKIKYSQILFALITFFLFFFCCVDVKASVVSSFHDHLNLEHVSLKAEDGAAYESISTEYEYEIDVNGKRHTGLLETLDESSFSNTINFEGKAIGSISREGNHIHLSAKALSANDKTVFTKVILSKKKVIEITSSGNLYLKIDNSENQLFTKSVIQTESLISQKEVEGYAGSGSLFRIHKNGEIKNNAWTSNIYGMGIIEKSKTLSATSDPFLWHSVLPVKKGDTVMVETSRVAYLYINPPSESLAMLKSNVKPTKDSIYLISSEKDNFNSPEDFRQYNAKSLWANPFQFSNNLSMNNPSRL